MKTGISKYAFAIAAMGVMAAMPVSQASANDREEIRELLARVRKLEAKVARQEKQEKEDKTARHYPHGDNSPRGVYSGSGAEPPMDAFRYKGITITPGGFIALESVWRSRWMGADVATPFQNIPTGNSVAGHTDEFRFSARQSRLSMRIDGDVGGSGLITKGPPIKSPVHLTGYAEIDFLGAAQTANSNQTNSYNPRIRHLLTNVDWNELGLHVLAGQTWSLGTMYSDGITWDKWVLPPSIDAGYIPGFWFTRQPQIRIVKDLPYNFTAGFSVESGASTFAPGGAVAGLPFGTTVGTIPASAGFTPVTAATPPGGSLFNNGNTYSLNRLPDFIGKLTWDPNFFDRHIHIEGFGFLRDFQDRALWGNHSVWGGGFGGGAIIPIWPKYLDFQVSGAIGDGIGRYGAGQLSDSTLNVTGAPSPLHERMLLVGLTAHVTPQTDVYAFAGGEFQSANWSIARFGTGAVLVNGLGSPLFDNNGCDLESPVGITNAIATTASCQTKSIRQITGGVWHTIYQGDFGKLKIGAQYAYTVRDIFPGVGNTPKAIENQVMTSIRYYPF